MTETMCAGLCVAIMAFTLWCLIHPRRRMTSRAREDKLRARLHRERAEVKR